MNSVDLKKEWADFEILFEALKDKAAKLKVALGSVDSPASLKHSKKRVTGLTEEQKAEIISRRRKLVYGKIARNTLTSIV